MGCIEQVMRGYRGNAFSVFTLQYPPTADVWRQAVNVKSSGRNLTGAPTLDSLSASVEDLRKQIGGVNLVSALDNIEQRLKKLETAAKINPTNN
jgi:hypothetical protein